MTNIPPMKEPVSKRRPLPFLGGRLVVVVVEVVVGLVVGGRVGAMEEEAAGDTEGEGEMLSDGSILADEALGETEILGEADSELGVTDSPIEDIMLLLSPFSERK